MALSKKLCLAIGLTKRIKREEVLSKSPPIWPITSRILNTVLDISPSLLDT